MQVDIVKTGGKWAVYPRSAFEYDEYRGDPMFTAADESDCWDWCDRNRHEFRRRRNVMLVIPEFVKDVEERCDCLHKEMLEHAAKCGWTFSSNATYRASAAWKENPTHYCYRGDYGGGASFDGTNEESLRSPDGTSARMYLATLRGFSDGLWELGFTLTFDKDGKHTVYGKYPKWVTLDNED